MGPSGEKRLALATDPEDADHRREGIALLSATDWGLREPYLSFYAHRLAADLDPTVRGAAARALGKAVAVKYLPVLVKALGDSSPMVRCDAAVALARFRGEEAIEPLRKAAAEDASVDVRCAAIRALRYYPRPKVAGTLVYCLSDEVFDVRHEAHQVLVGMVGKDLGTEPADWNPVARGDVPLRAPQWQRPWWDWFGTTKPEEPRPQDGAASPPAPRERPWWDWLGVTGGRAPPAPTATPASQPAPGPAKHSEAGSAPVFEPTPPAP
jgi:hypothetical protein